jgi:hypothetical protein
MKRFWGPVAVALFLLAVAAVVAVGIRLARDGFEPHVPRRVKEYTWPVAENFRYRDYEHIGVDQFTFKSCHVEKRRVGSLTLGAFNVLVIHDLIVNFFPEGGLHKEEGPAERELFEGVLLAQDKERRGFSGVRIHGLTVNRLASNTLERVFSAKMGESALGKEGLSLHGTVVRAPGGQEEQVGNARLLLKPSPALVYLKDGVRHQVSL